MKKAIIISLILLTWPMFSNGEESNFDISLTWTANTFIPDDYQGKALPIRGSRVSVVATILGQRAQNLNFVWYLDRRIQKYASGGGKNIFNFIVSEWPGYQHTVSVKIKDLENYLLTEENITIPVQEPEIHLYLNNQSIRRYVISPGAEIQFRAVAYYFNISDISQLKYQWKFEGAEISEFRPPDPYLFNLAISPDSRTNISRDLTLRVENKNNYLERAKIEALIKIE